MAIPIDSHAKDDVHAGNTSVTDYDVFYKVEIYFPQDVQLDEQVYLCTKVLHFISL